MPSQPVVLQAKKLTKSFRGFVAVQQVDLEIRKNSIHALIGPNGAGKTTVFNLLTKFLTPTSGAIELAGQDITRMKPADVARLGMVRSFQISAVFPHLGVLENVVVALQRQAGLATQLWRSKKCLAELEHRAFDLLVAVSLEDHRDKLAAELSYGRKRALELATTLALDPQVLLLDEPMAGLGLEDIVGVTKLIRNISENRTIVMVEHNLSVVSDLCDQVTVLARGKILAQGSYGDVSRNPTVREAYMGTAHA